MWLWYLEILGKGSKDTLYSMAGNIQKRNSLNKFGITKKTWLPKKVIIKEN